MSPPRPSETRRHKFQRVIGVLRTTRTIHVLRISRVAFRMRRLRKICIACCRVDKGFGFDPSHTRSPTLLQAPGFHFPGHLARGRTSCIYQVSTIQYPLLLALLLHFDITVNTCLYKVQMAPRGSLFLFANSGIAG